MVESRDDTMTPAIEDVIARDFPAHQVLEAAGQLALDRGIPVDGVTAAELLAFLTAARSPAVADSATTLASSATSFDSEPSDIRMHETRAVTMTPRMEAVMQVYDFPEELVLEAATQLMLRRGISLDNIDVADLVTFCEEAGSHNRPHQ